ncbi:hypothetical protein [Kitasatospora sp. NPDC088351]|uniref:hypothetical protein n=1 Tax=Kitasatospora sp. NPDC088351 TaxID=3155180 RepID=UPI00342FD1CB
MSERRSRARALGLPVELVGQRATPEDRPARPVSDDVRTEDGHRALGLFELAVRSA